MVPSTLVRHQLALVTLLGMQLNTKKTISGLPRARASWGLDREVRSMSSYFDRYNVKYSALYKSERGTCGAKTRKGTPCQAPPVWNKLFDRPRNGRCKLHGGLSTGPRTQAGKKAIIRSNKNRCAIKTPSDQF